MKGFVPTPDHVVDLIVDKLFSARPPAENCRLLDPGCGAGAFIDGVMRWCAFRGLTVPSIVGVDSDPEHIGALHARYEAHPRVRVLRADFLARSEERFDYIVGNPPYVSIGSLSEAERRQYRRDFLSASGRFDLYLLFFEQALRLLKPDGRLVFITPEKYVYVQSAAPLRVLLAQRQVEELHFVEENTFEGLVTYPLITTVSGGQRSSQPTTIIQRDGSTRQVQLPRRKESWLPSIRGAPLTESPHTLGDICVRISCGVATGSDSTFVLRSAELPADLERFAYPTIAGRDITSRNLPRLLYSMLVPYDATGTLLPEQRLGALGALLSREQTRRKLLARTCASRKEWYAFHETPPLADILRPKILCKDIGATPVFVVDADGSIVPRHSVYYIVPRDGTRVEEIADYLNSALASAWLEDHCQRAAGGFLRLQSHVLKRLPIPVELLLPARSRTPQRATSDRRSA